MQVKCVYKLAECVFRVTRDDVIASTWIDVWLTALEERLVERCTLNGWWAWQRVSIYFMSSWVETNAALAIMYFILSYKIYIY